MLVQLKVFDAITSATFLYAYIINLNIEQIFSCNRYEAKKKIKIKKYWQLNRKIGLLREKEENNPHATPLLKFQKK